MVDEFATLTLNVHVDGTLVAQEKARVKHLLLTQDDPLLDGLIRQKVLNLVASLGIRNRTSVRTKAAAALSAFESQGTG